MAYKITCQIFFTSHGDGVCPWASTGVNLNTQFKGQCDNLMACPVMTHRDSVDSFSD